MNFKGTGKHTIEELEEIIDDLFEEKRENDFDRKNEQLLLNELSELARDIYHSCKSLDDGQDTEVLKTFKNNLATYIEGFARDNRFQLR